MSLARNTAIEEFEAGADLDRRVLDAISKVLAKSPRAVLIVWEEDNALGMTSVPFSHSLIKGMVDTAFDVIFADAPDLEAADDD